ncbi:MAG: ABC transporter permease [Candidatus Calescibacterium sp.]|nr:ABC transporter permease [Candidatus Calescibacterium sp.]MCX7734065.1 ABC transporter permease [bacterium]MDW8087063.1 ABC transporter permease [Candidatus Calescibacterium sp.]
MLKQLPTDVRIAVFILIALFLFALSYPILPYTYYEQFPERTLEGFSLEHPFGTDEIGRDLLARTSYGLGISLRVAITAALIATILGTVIGIISGWFGGIVDVLIMRFIDFFISIPDIILIVLISLVIGQGEIAIIAAISLGAWLSVARVIRGEVVKLKNEEFIASAILVGNSTLRIFFKHIIPNIINYVIVMLVLRVPTAILTESGLSFIGLGLKPPTSSLGVLAEEGFRAISIYPRFIIIPSVLIFLLVWSINAIGEYMAKKVQR